MGSISGRRSARSAASGLADLIERNCRYATRFADGLRAAGYQILNDVALNQVLVSFGDAERTRRVVAAVQADGTCWCGSTVWHGQTAMRISVSSWATTDADVERSLRAILRIARTHSGDEYRRRLIGIAKYPVESLRRLHHADQSSERFLINQRLL